MIGPCLCGDTHCPSCGPAQGCYRCDVCGAWSDDENDDGTVGCVDPARCERESKAAADQYAADIEEERIHRHEVAEYLRSLDADDKEGE